jgi:hypothetical protein
MFEKWLAVILSTYRFSLVPLKKQYDLQQSSIANKNQHHSPRTQGDFDGDDDI